MPFDKPAIVAANLPDDLPTCEEIVALCRKQGYNTTGTTICSSPGLICAWVKYGCCVTMAEARTQSAVADMVNTVDGTAVLVPKVYLAFRHDDTGYIVMEYIDGSDCSESDVIKVAPAVQQLIDLRIPATDGPGPVGGGRITHRFFVEWMSAVPYGTVALLQKHINNILKSMPVVDRVDFTAETEQGLGLCLCDINPGNFRINKSGMVVALDFGATCFLPVSFFAFAMFQSDHFGSKVAKRLKYPASSNLNAMLKVAGYLVPFGRNDLCLPSALKSQIIPQWVYD